MAWTEENNQPLFEKCDKTSNSHLSHISNSTILFNLISIAYFLNSSILSGSVYLAFAQLTIWDY